MIEISKPACRAEHIPLSTTPCKLSPEMLNSFRNGNRVIVREAMIVVESGPARVSFTEDPVGHYLPAGTILHLSGAGNLKTFAAQAGSPAPAALSVTYFE